MKIQKKLNDLNRYDITITNEGKELTVKYAGNDDLYMSVSNGERLKQDVAYMIAFYISKQEEALYAIFDKLYNAVQIIGNRELTKDGKILWVSDDGLEDTEDKLLIARQDDYYRLLFCRSDKIDPTKRKSSRNIVVRFSNSGSRYADTASLFIDMYHDLTELEEPKVLEK